MAKVDTSLVAHLPLFAGVTPEALDEILREARSARYPKNSAIFEQGADAQSFFLLLHERRCDGAAARRTERRQGQCPEIRPRLLHR